MSKTIALRTVVASILNGLVTPAPTEQVPNPVPSEKVYYQQAEKGAQKYIVFNLDFALLDYDARHLREQLLGLCIFCCLECCCIIYQGVSILRCAELNDLFYNGVDVCGLLLHIYVAQYNLLLGS